MRTPRFYSRIILSLLLLVIMVGSTSLAQEEATSEPTVPSTEIPTETPTEVATEPPTEVPTEVPTELPTEAPTEVLTEVVTEPPTVEVTEVATEPPTAVPTEATAEASPPSEVTPETTPVAELTAEATLETLFAPAPLVARVEPVTEASLMAVQTFVVNSVLDDPDMAANGICDSAPAAGNQCTLRAAIQEANADAVADKDTINFNIPGTGPHTITPATVLPLITQSVIINGASEPYYTWGTPRIVLDGGTVMGGNGLELAAGSDGSTIKGLVINGGWVDGIRVLSANNLIQGNFLGTNAAGTAADGNNLVGVQVYESGATNNVIGGTTAALRNITSGNINYGVFIYLSPGGNRIQGNYIGTNKTGTVDLGNGSHGVLVWSSNGNTIGGATAAARNLISGNGSDGIYIVGNSNMVMGNYIGTSANGSGNLFNGGHGVDINNGANNIVGGAYPQAANRIANNSGDGIFVNVGTGNRLLTNWIYNNTGLGIDLAPDGLTYNDGGDGDSGANDLQNYPVLQRTSGTRYVGYLHSLPNEVFRLQFFASPTCDGVYPDTYGEGQRYLGTAAVVTNSLGDASFDLLLPIAATTGWAVTATATSEFNNTSEFGNCVKANLGTPVLLGPANNSLTYDTTPTFSWKAVPGAEQYLIQVSRYPTFDLIYLSDIVSAPTTSWTPGIALERGESYYWHVRAEAFGWPGAWSATWRINIAP